MNSLLIKRLPGILALGLVTLAVGAAGVPAGASTSVEGSAHVSGLTKKQHKAKKKALKKCSKKKARTKRATRKKRAKCKRAVIKKYKRLARTKPSKGITRTVDVVDDEFKPADLTIKAGDSINWVWSNDNANAHNVTLGDGPSSLTDADKYNLSSPNSPSVQYSFKRPLTKPGNYYFFCTLHSTVMDLNVKVTK